MQSSDSASLNVAVVGLGTIGRAVAAAVRAADDLTLVGGVDVNPAALSAARGDLAGVPLVESVDELGPTDAAIVCVGWRFDRLGPTLRQLMARRTAVVSDCAEMAWPWLRHPHLADVVAGEARKAAVPLIGLGASPAAALAIAAAVNRLKDQKVSRVRVRRQMDLAAARASVHRQIGVGRTTKQFRALAAERLVGMPSQAEWVVLIAQALGRHPMRADVSTAMRPTTGDDAAVSGLHMRSAWSDDTFDIEVDETAAVGLTPESDTIEWTIGEATDQAVLPSGDSQATAAQLVGFARRARTLPAGLLTALDTFSIANLKES